MIPPADGAVDVRNGPKRQKCRVANSSHWSERDVYKRQEQVICLDSNIDAEKFAKEKTAIFLVWPEEDRTKNFMAGLMIQNLSKEL